MSAKVAIVHSPEYENWVFSTDHPTQGRRFINGFNAIKNSNVDIQRLLSPQTITVADLSRVHSKGYIKEVTHDHTCFEWTGARQDLSRLAQLFAGGTLVALDALLKGEADLAIHLPGGKHHAQYDHSSGFCIFNDFAIAADVATWDHGLKVAILDIDAHHGDGVENLTRENPNVLTFSIHESGIFPGTGDVNELENSVFNFPIRSENGGGDSKLLAGVNNFIPIARSFDLDILFITAGADGLKEDPLTNLEYTIEGYATAATLIRSSFPSTPILMGGAGGYLPDDGTPAVWAAVAEKLAA